MNTPSVDELLARSAPELAAGPGAEAALDALVLETRQAVAEARPRRRRRRLWLVPGAVLTIGVLTAGAVVVKEYAYARIDVPVKIHWTTSSGKLVECQFVLDGGTRYAPKQAEVIDYYRTHDFSDTGQQIYHYARVLTGAEQPGPNNLPEWADWNPETDFNMDASMALSIAVDSYLTIPAEIELGLGGKYPGTTGSSHTDCLDVHDPEDRAAEDLQ